MGDEDMKRMILNHSAIFKMVIVTALFLGGFGLLEGQLPEWELAASARGEFVCSGYTRDESKQIAFYDEQLLKESIEDNADDELEQLKKESIEDKADDELEQLKKRLDRQAGTLGVIVFLIFGFWFLVYM